MVKNCDLSKENNIMIQALKENITSIKDSVGKIENSNKEMFNHFSERYEIMFEKLRNRIPYWVVISSTILGSILTGLAVFLITQ